MNLELQCVFCKNQCEFTKLKSYSYIEYVFTCNTINCYFKSLLFNNNEITTLVLKIGKYDFSIEYYYHGAIVFYDGDVLTEKGFDFFNSIFDDCKSHEERINYIESLILLN